MHQENEGMQGSTGMTFAAAYYLATQMVIYT